MRVAVFGVGGVGGYFGARLAAAGSEVAFIARGAHLRAMREKGLVVRSPLGDLHLAKVVATDDPATIGPVDIVMFCVKLYDVESAAARLAPLLGSETTVISFQNGIDAEDRIEAVIGAGRVAGGVAYLSASLGAPGEVLHHNRLAKLAFGGRDGRVTAPLQALKAACDRAGIDAVLSPEIEKTIWEKFLFLASFAAVTGATRHAIGPVLADPVTRQLFVDAMSEIAAVAKARGIGLSEDAVARQLDVASKLAPDMKASLLHDLERGNRIEIEGLSGAVLRLGRALGVPTPVHAALYAALKLHAPGRG